MTDTDQITQDFCDYLSLFNNESLIGGVEFEMYGITVNTHGLEMEMEKNGGDIDKALLKILAPQVDSVDLMAIELEVV